jgi:hypothetical protein
VLGTFLSITATAFVVSFAVSLRFPRPIVRREMRTFFAASLVTAAALAGMAALAVVSWEGAVDGLGFFWAAVLAPRAAARWNARRARSPRRPTATKAIG